MKLQELGRDEETKSVHGTKTLVSTMYTTQSVKKGSELINNYGSLDRGMLLLKYGVCD
jgi:hypothetical protein